MLDNLDENKKKFLESLYKNLETNGFPQKSVSFPLEKIYEFADRLNVNFNQVRDEMKKILVDTKTDGDKIIFTKLYADEKSPLGKAMKMFENMSDDQKKQMFEQFQNMSEEEKADIMEKGKKMGII